MTIHVFISHAYDQRKLYNSIVHRLEDRDDFDWYDCSVPRHRRYGTDGREKLSDDQLRELLAGSIANCDVVIAIAKPVATRREWIRWEIEYAKSLGKPIIAVWRRNVDKRVSSFVLRLADLQVDTWHIRSIIRALETSHLIARSRTAASLAAAEANAARAMHAIDQDTLIDAVSDEPVAPPGELALTDDERSQLDPRSVVGDALVRSRRLDNRARIELADAFSKLAGKAESAVQSGLPREIIGEPLTKRRWWQFWQPSQPPDRPNP